MAAPYVRDLRAARRYCTNVLLHLDVSGNEITLARFLQLLDHFAEHPSEYLELIQCQEQ